MSYYAQDMPLPPPKKRVIWSKMSTMPRLRNLSWRKNLYSDLDIYLIWHPLPLNLISYPMLVHSCHIGLFTIPCMCQTHSHLRVFVQAISFAENTLHPDTHIINSFTSFNPLLNFTFSIRPPLSNLFKNLTPPSQWHSKFT